MCRARSFFSLKLHGGGLERIGQIGGQINLGLIETYDIHSLQMKMAILQTREDIFRLIDEIV